METQIYFEMDIIPNTTFEKRKKWLFMIIRARKVGKKIQLWDTKEIADAIKEADDYKNIHTTSYSINKQILSST